MTPGPGGILWACALFSCVGIAFGGGAWFTLRRFGPGAAILWWIIGSVLVAGLMTLCIHQQQTALGFTPEQQQRFPIFWAFLPLWGIAFGATTLVAIRASGRPNAEYGVRRAGQMLAAYLAGTVLFFVIYFALDVGGLLNNV